MSGVSSPDAAGRIVGFSREELGAALDAYGTDERKALSVLAMEPSVPYGLVEQTRLYHRLQGDQLVDEGAMMVRLAGRRASRLPAETAATHKAIASLLLDVSSCGPLTLNQPLGTAQGRAGPTPPQLVKLDILGALLGVKRSITRAELEGHTGIPGPRLRDHLSWLLREGVVLDKSPSYHSDTVYVMRQYIRGYETVRQQRKLTAEVVATLNRIRRSGWTISLNAIHDVIEKGRTPARTDNPKVLRDEIASCLRGLAGQGLLEHVEGLKLAPNNQKQVARLVTGLQKIRVADRITMRDSLMRGSQILADKALVGQLIAKAMAHSPSTQGLPATETAARITAFLQEHGTTSSTQIRDHLVALGGRPDSAAKVLRQLWRDNKLGRAEKGRTALWTLLESDSEAATSTD